MNRTDLDKEIKEKVKEGVKPSDLKKKNGGENSIPTPPPLPQENNQKAVLNAIQNLQEQTEKLENKIIEVQVYSRQIPKELGGIKTENKELKELFITSIWEEIRRWFIFVANVIFLILLVVTFLSKEKN